MDVALTIVSVLMNVALLSDGCCVSMDIALLPVEHLETKKLNIASHV